MLILNSEECFDNEELLIIYHDDSSRPTPVFHVHNYYEITIVLSGKMDCHFEDCVFHLEAGDVLLVKPGDPHWRESFDGIRQYNVSVLPSVVENALSYLATEDDSAALFSLRHLPPCTLASSDFKHICHTAALLSEEYVTSSFNLRLRLRSLVIDILSAYLVQSSRTSKTGSTVPRWLELFLEDFYRQSNLQKGVAFFDNAPVSHGHLCRLFKQHYGMTIIQFVNDARLSYAARMLLQEDVPIIQISEDIGFSSLSHFYRLFKVKYGVTPKDYRTLGVDHRARLFKTLPAEQAVQAVVDSSVFKP